MRSKQGRGVAEASLTITIFRSEWLLFKFKSKGYWTTGGPSSRLEKKCHALRDSVLSYGGTVENLNTLWGIVWGAKYSFIFWNMNILHVKSIEVSKISAQPHPTLCIQFLNRENNDKVVPGDFCRFLLVLPSLLFFYKTKMSNNKTTAPIFFSSFLSLWPKYLLPPVTRIFLP